MYMDVWITAMLKQFFTNMYLGFNKFEKYLLRNHNVFYL